MFQQNLLAFCQFENFIKVSQDIELSLQITSFQYFNHTINSQAIARVKYSLREQQIDIFILHASFKKDIQLFLIGQF
jgi:hypothetical protein